MITVSGPRSPRGFRSLRGWAILQKAVTATGVDIDHALIAAANRTNAGVPFPRWLRPVPLGRIIRVDVRVDIGLCIRRLYPDDHRYTPTIIATTLKPAIKARFMIFSFEQFM